MLRRSETPAQDPQMSALFGRHAVLELALAFALLSGLPRVTVAGAAAPSSAETPLPLLEANPDSALAVALEQIEGTPLSLEDAVARALEQATPVREAEAARRAARGAVRREKGAFDPELYGRTQKTSAETPSASPFTGTPVLETEETATSAGARMKLRFGTELSASLETSRQETNNAYTSLNPEVNTTGRLSVRQPLLKGFGPGARGGLSSAERALDAAEARYQDAALAVRAETERAYWDLYAAERDFAVQTLIRDRAAAFLAETELRARAGLVGPNQTASARVFLAEQEQALLDREEGLDRVSDRLATLAGMRPGEGHPRFQPTDEPPADFPVESAEALVARALAASPELRAAGENVAAARALAAAARWNALPALDFTGSWGGAGLSGTGRPVVIFGDTIPNDMRGGFGDTWGQVRRRDFPNWSVGLEFSVPLGLRAGRGERARLLAETDRAEQALVAMRRSVEERVRASHRELEHAARRLQAARAGVDASSEQVRIGVLEYRAGRTTAFELVRLGADLAAAQQRYSQALVRAAKAAADLRRLAPVEDPGRMSPGAPAGAPPEGGGER